MLRDEIVNDVFMPIYSIRDSYLDNCAPETLLSISPHRLSILFAVFALGTLVDLTAEVC